MYKVVEFTVDKRSTAKPISLRALCGESWWEIASTLLVVSALATSVLCNVDCGGGNPGGGVMAAVGVTSDPSPLPGLGPPRQGVKLGPASTPPLEELELVDGAAGVETGRATSGCLIPPCGRCFVLASPNLPSGRTRCPLGACCSL